MFSRRFGTIAGPIVTKIIKDADKSNSVNDGAKF